MPADLLSASAARDKSATGCKARLRFVANVGSGDGKNKDFTASCAQQHASSARLKALETLVSSGLSPH
jgi:hypothetical protein